MEIELENSVRTIRENWLYQVLHASRTKMLSVSVSHKVETSLFYREKEKVCFKDCVRMIQRCCFSFILFSNAVLRPRCVHMAYFLVHSLAHSLYLDTSVL